MVLTVIKVRLRQTCQQHLSPVPASAYSLGARAVSILTQTTGQSNEESNGIRLEHEIETEVISGDCKVV